MQRFPFSRVLILSICVVALLATSVWYVLKKEQPMVVTAQVASLNGSIQNDAGFKRVTEPRAFTFPSDHGPHSEYQTEWWYYTGNLETEEGRKFGYQLTFFRQGISSEPISRTAQWATNEIYLAHFTVSDIESGEFYMFERTARGGEVGLAGATGDPFRIYVEDWSTEGNGNTVVLNAKDDKVSIKLSLRSSKLPTLQGDGGLSPKSVEPGKASYYYSLTNMETTGIIIVDNLSFGVTGVSWFDHEWATSPLTSNQVGWEWFGLHLDDGRDVMWGQLRRRDGSVDFGGGSITGPTQQGTRIALNDVMILKPNDATLTTLDTWQSSETQITYPSQWQLNIPNANLQLEITPLLADQELRLPGMIYWEGAVKVSGDNVTGFGYAELTGYGGAGSPLR